MAKKKSTPAPAAESVTEYPATPETVEVPYLSQPFGKAPKVDPYLKPGSYTTETLTFGDIELPPIMRGIEPHPDLQGRPTDYHVKVIWISRRQIDWVLREIEQQQPELETVLHIVSKWMSNMDTMRSEAKLGIGAGMSWLKGDKPDVKKALEQLQQVQEMLGSWHDEHRLYLR
jgi:hypothetical protein